MSVSSFSVWKRLTVLLVVLLGCHCVASVNDDDDFTPASYSSADDVRIAHKYPHLGLTLEEQDNTFFSSEESTKDYAISLIVFPALVAGICFIGLLCFSLCVCCRCFCLGCLNCWKRICRCCIKDCCRKSKEKKHKNEEAMEKRYAIYSKTFPFLLFCCAFSIVWVFEGASRINDGVDETQLAMSKFGGIVTSISDELKEMSVTGENIEAFLNNNLCPPIVADYLDDMAASYESFNNGVESASRVTASVEPAIDRANEDLESSWVEYQNLIFNVSAAILLGVLFIYLLGVCMKTAILMRLGILLTVLISLALCLLVFIEMVVVMAYADFCVAPTTHIERAVSGGAYDVVHYYTSCEGRGPLYDPVDEVNRYNRMMNETVMALLEDNPDVFSSCESGALALIQDFSDIADNVLNVVEFAKCPYINDLYSTLILDGFCTYSYSGLYNIHVSHLTTLVLFFLIVVNAAVLYPHYKGKTLRHLCFCCYSKEELEAADKEHDEPDIFGDLRDSEETLKASGQFVSAPVSTVDEDDVEMVIYQDNSDVELGDTTFNMNPSYNPSSGSFNHSRLVSHQENGIVEADLCQDDSY